MHFIELGFGHNVQAQYKIRCHISQSRRRAKPPMTLHSLALKKTSDQFGGVKYNCPYPLVLRYREGLSINLSGSYLLH